MSRYPLLDSQRRSRILLGVICVLFIVTLPVGVWLFILSKSSIEVTQSDIKLRPLGKSFHIDHVERWGLGNLKNLVPSQSLQNPSGAPQHLSVRLALIELKTGKRIRIPLSNYHGNLERALIESISKKPQGLVQKGLFRLRFK